MGKLVSSTIPNLISGVSQQPWNVRLPTQAEEQVNCQSSVTDFLKRRPATRHLARIRDTPAANGIASHHINRDETEQYIVTADASGINVFDLEGNAKTVSVTGTGAAYLAAATAPNRDLRFLTINDYTFVLNRRVAVKTLPGLSPKRQPEAIVFIKQASYNTTYQLTLNGNVYSTLTADGLSDTEKASPLPDAIGIYRSLHDAIPSDYVATTISPLGLVLTVPASEVSGINMTNTGASANIWAITGGIAPYTTYGVVIRGQQYSITTGSGATEDTQVADPLSSMDIAKSLAAQIPQSVFSVQTSNSTIWIRRHDGGDFTVKVQDSRSNTHTSVCKGKVQRFSDLPTVAPRGFVTEIIGDASSSFDNYFCVFERLRIRHMEGNRQTRHPLQAGPGDPAPRPHPAGRRHLHLRPP